MSSPNGRSSNPNWVSPYAPKWARDLHAVSGSGQGARATDRNRVDYAAPTNPNFGIADLSYPPSLEPSLVPGPPTPELWHHRKMQPLLRSNYVTRMLFRVLLVILLAALISFLFVLVFPVSRTFVATRQIVAGNTKKHSSNVPPAAARLQSTASKSSAASSADRSGSTPSRKDWGNAQPRGNALIQPGTLPMLPPASVWPPVGVPTAPRREIARAVPTTPEPPPAARTQPNAVGSKIHTLAVPTLSIKTVPIKRTEPVRSLGRDEIDTLIKQGYDFVSVGDFASARVVFGRVAEAGDARGALALAATYDPIALKNVGIRGATPDLTKARQWYHKASELGSRDAKERLAALDRRTYSTAAAESSAFNAVAAGHPPSSKTAGTTESYWESNSSIFRLEASGPSRRLVYFRPSDAELKAGARAGVVRFDGRLSGGGYVGTAYSYFGKCGRWAYQVSGQVENNGARVSLSGTSPDLDSNCRMIGKTEQTFVFNFISPPNN